MTVALMQEGLYIPTAFPSMMDWAFWVAADMASAVTGDEKNRRMKYMWLIFLDFKGMSALSSTFMDGRRFLYLWSGRRSVADWTSGDSEREGQLLAERVFLYSRRQRGMYGVAPPLLNRPFVICQANGANGRRPRHKSIKQ